MKTVAPANIFMHFLYEKEMLCVCCPMLVGRTCRHNLISRSLTLGNIPLRCFSKPAPTSLHVVSEINHMFTADILRQRIGICKVYAPLGSAGDVGMQRSKGIDALNIIG